MVPNQDQHIDEEPMLTAKPAIDSRQQCTSANKRRLSKSQSGLVKPTDATEKRDKKRRICPRALYVPSGLKSSKREHPRPVLEQDEV